MEMNTTNPVLNRKFWSSAYGNDRMSIEGSLNKIGILLGVTILSAIITAVLSLNAMSQGDGGALLGGLAGIGMIGGLVMSLVIIFKRPQQPATMMTLYAIFEGMFIGALSIFFESSFSGIVFQAAFGTMCITLTMYGAYASKMLRPTPTFNKVVGGLMASIFMLYLISLVLRMFSGFDVPFLHSSGPIGIGVTAFILVIAALTLISDFGFIESGVRYGAPKNMEWYAAFGILVSLIWIYIEMLRLLSKLRD